MEYFLSLLLQIGGYIGLFLGYALLQTPDLCYQILEWLQRKKLLNMWLMTLEWLQTVFVNKFARGKDNGDGNVIISE